MTVLQGSSEPRKVQTYSDFEEKLGATGREVLKNLPAKHREQIISQFNSQEPENAANSVSELPEHVFDQYTEWLEHLPLDLNDVIKVVLHKRDREYIHLFCPPDFPTHTIVPLTGDEARVFIDGEIVTPDGNRQQTKAADYEK
jgi:hypothetical protein